MEDIYDFKLLHPVIKPIYDCKYDDVLWIFIRYTKSIRSRTKKSVPHVLNDAKN